MTCIVKVQRPVYTNDPSAEPLWLIYKKDRRGLKMQKVPVHVLTEMGSDLKAFFLANWNPRSEEYDILKRTEHQDW